MIKSGPLITLNFIFCPLKIQDFHSMLCIDIAKQYHQLASSAIDQCFNIAEVPSLPLIPLRGKGVDGQYHSNGIVFCIFDAYNGIVLCPSPTGPSCSILWKSKIFKEWDRSNGKGWDLKNGTRCKRERMEPSNYNQLQSKIVRDWF